jgi:hypothetical protein
MLFIYHFFILVQATGQTAGPILTLDGSFDTGFAKELPYAGEANYKTNLGAKFPRKLKI